MNSDFGKVWWYFLLKGIIVLLFGVFFISMPIAAFTALSVFLGVFMFVYGIFSVIAAIQEKKNYGNWTWLLIFGLLGIAAGIVTFINPFTTLTAIIYIIAFWALIIGIGEIIWAIRLRNQIKGEGWYIFAGVLSIVFGILLLFYPTLGAITLALIFGIYALIIGVILIALSLRLRKHRSGNETFV